MTSSTAKPIETAYMKLCKLSRCQDLYAHIQKNNPVFLYFSYKNNDLNKPDGYYHVRSVELLNCISAPAILYNKTIILAVNRYENITCSSHIHIVRLNNK